MKARKILATLAAVLVAASVCALTACGDSGSEEVTKEEWIAAFSEESFANAKIDYMTETSNRYNSKRREDYIKINADGIYFLKGKTTAYQDNKTRVLFEDEMYYTVVDGVDTVYVKETNGWEKTTPTDPTYDPAYKESFKETIPDSAFLVELYDECTFNSKKGYIYTVIEDETDPVRGGIITTSNIVIRFKGKKIVEIVGETVTTLISHFNENETVSELYSTRTLSYKIKYGGQKLTLPQIV